MLIFFSFDCRGSRRRDGFYAINFRASNVFCHFFTLASLWRRVFHFRRTMSENSVLCHCQHCDADFEFDAGEFQEGDKVTVNCPHCQMEANFILTPVAPKPPILKVSKRKSGVGKWILFTLAVAVAVALAAIAIWCIQPVDITWSQSDTIQNGDIQVKIESVSIGPVFINNGEGLGMTPSQNYFLIKLKVTNLSQTRKADFSTWRATSLFDSNNSSLSDNFGNAYKQIVFTQPLYFSQDESAIYPQQSLYDTVVFEIPVKNYQWLHLQLSASNFGGDGKLRFEIANSNK